MEEETEARIRKDLSEMDPSFSITDIGPANNLVALTGRSGGKSEFLRVKGHREDYDSNDEYTVKVYLRNVKSIGGAFPALRGYYTEKAVLKTIPDQPRTYFKAKYYDDKGLFLIFPKIANSTLEERIYHAPMSYLLEKSIEPVKNWHSLSHPLEFKEQLEIGLNQFSDGKFKKLREPSRKDYSSDLERYTAILRDIGVGLSQNQKNKIVEGITLEKFIGPNTHDGYPWHNLGEGGYLIDSGDVNMCSFGLHLGCLIGHHSIYSKIGSLGAENIINGFSKDPDLKKAFYACAVYANLREMAGALTVGKIKLHNRALSEYLHVGHECVIDQLGRI